MQAPVRIFEDQFLHIGTLVGHAIQSVGGALHLRPAIHWQLLQGQAVHLIIQQQLEELAVLGCVVPGLGGVPFSIFFTH
jgi:hypothetical protein